MVRKSHRCIPIALMVIAALVATAHAGGKNQIRAVTVDDATGPTLVRVRGTQTPTFTVYKLERPTRVVVDVASAELAEDVRGAESSAVWTPQTWAVGQVAAQQMSDGGSIVRIVVTLARPGRYDVKADGKDLIVVVNARDAQPAAASPAELVKARAEAAAARDDASRATAAKTAADQARLAADQARAAAEADADKARAQAAAARADAERARAQATAEGQRAKSAQAAAESAQRDARQVQKTSQDDRAAQAAAQKSIDEARAEAEAARRAARAAEAEAVRARKAAEAETAKARAASDAARASAETARAEAAAEAERVRRAAVSEAEAARKAMRAVQAEADAARKAADKDRKAAEAARAEADRILAQARTRLATVETQEQAARAEKARADQSRKDADAREQLARAAEARAAAERSAAEAAARKAAIARDRTDGQAAAERARLEAAAKSAEERLRKAEAERVAAERERAAAATAAAAARQEAEKALGAIASAEKARVAAEQAKTSAESSRASAEQAQREADGRRAAAESERLLAEKRKSSAEAAASEAAERAERARALRKDEETAAARAAHARADAEARRDAAARAAAELEASVAAASRAGQVAQARARAADTARQAADAAARRKASEAEVATARAEAARLEREHQTAAAAVTAKQHEVERRQKVVAELDAARDAASAEVVRLRTSADGARAARQKEEALLADVAARRASEERELVRIQKERQEAESARTVALAAKGKADQDRAVAESARVRADEQRTAAETARNQAETARQSAEHAKARAEKDRLAAETAKARAESVRAAAEAATGKAEKDRLAAEAARSKAAEERLALEAARSKAAEEKLAAEAARRQAAQERLAVQAARSELEQERRAAEAQAKARAKTAPGVAAVIAKEPSAKEAPVTVPTRTIAVRDVGFVGAPDAGRIVVDLAGAADARVVSTGPRRAELVIDGATLPDALQRTLDTSRFHGPVKAVSTFRDAKQPGRVRIVVELTEPATPKLERVGKAVHWSFASERTSRVASKARSIPPPIVGGFGASSAPITQTSVAQLNPGGRRRVYRGTTVDLDFKEAPIHDLLRLLSDVGRVNIVVPDDINARVTVRMKRVPWDQALEVILSSKGLWYRREGNLIRVAPRKQLDTEDQAEAERRRAAVESEAPEPEVMTLNYASSDELSAKLTPLLSPKGKIEVDSRTNSLIVNDLAAHRRRIAALAVQLDTQTPQISIEARIVEARSTYQRQFGIQWGGRATASAATGNATGLTFPSSVGVAGGADDADTNSTGTATPSDFAVNLPASVGTGSGGALGLALGSIGGNFNINLRLSALEDSGTVRIISAPKITVLNNTKALISQGVKIPISVVSAQGTQTQFVNADLALSVQPYVSQRDCAIAMDIEVTKNEADFVNTGARGDPTILSKEAKTRILVGDGETTVLGGIYTRNAGLSYSKVPFFGDIPVLGWLFKNRSENDDRTEVLVFITPKITNKAFLRCQ
jgi:type IV pilus assembly protein PilQ